MDKIATLEISIFTGELGFISNEIQKLIDAKLLIALDIRN